MCHKNSILPRMCNFRHPPKILLVKRTFCLHAILFSALCMAPWSHTAHRDKGSWQMLPDGTQWATLQTSVVVEPAATETETLLSSKRIEIEARPRHLEIWTKTKPRLDKFKKESELNGTNHLLCQWKKGIFQWFSWKCSLFASYSEQFQKHFWFMKWKNKWTENKLNENYGMLSLNKMRRPLNVWDQHEK